MGFGACDCGGAVGKLDSSAMDAVPGDVLVDEAGIAEGSATVTGANDASESGATDANVGGPDDATMSSTADAADDGPSLPDAGPLDEGGAIEDAPVCASWALGGVGTPVGTMARATSIYTQYAASLAIDGSLTTAWWASGYQASLTITFPAPTVFSGVRLAAAAVPATSEVYTILGSDGTTVIGRATANPTVGQPPTYSILPKIPVTPGAYSSITISVDGMLSWVQINEISLLTAACP